MREAFYGFFVGIGLALLGHPVPSLGFWVGIITYTALRVWWLNRKEKHG